MSTRSQSTTMRRVAFASCAGTTIEFYDFYIYGTAAALVFPTVFFPALGGAAGTVASFATFAVAFIARPLGALIFGHFGDRLGRKQTLVTSLLLMGGATVAVGVLPGAATIGAAAPVLLVVFRLLQGIAVGGEWAGATLLATEYAEPNKRGLYAVFPQLGPAIGFALSSGVFLIVNRFVGDASDAFVGWGWRLPFIASAGLVLVGLYVRLNVGETPVFEAEKQDRLARRSEEGSPIINAIRTQWKEILLAGGALTLPFALFFMGATFLTSYGTRNLGLSRSSVLGLGIVASAIFALAVVISGVFSDRIGRKKILITACLLGIPWGLVLFPLIDHGTPLAFLLGISGSLLILGIAYGPAGALLPEMFSTEHRYTGAGMAYNLAGILGGATAPTIASKLAEMGKISSIGWMLVMFAVLSLVCTVVLPETSARTLVSSPNSSPSAKEV